MLKVSMHAGPVETATVLNRLAWLDIGYDKLELYADYKTVLYQNGIGESPQGIVYNYPRWSSSLWDLTARALALGLRPDPECIDVVVPPLVQTGKSFGFIGKMCALIEHFPGVGEGNRRTLASATVDQVKRQRGRYVARFEEHATAGAVSTEEFAFTPDTLRASELILHACLMRLTGKPEIPAKPALCVPPPMLHDGESVVSIQSLTEPARTGFTSWLTRRGTPPTKMLGERLGVAPEALYVTFLRTAV